MTQTDELAETRLPAGALSADAGIGILSGPLGVILLAGAEPTGRRGVLVDVSPVGLLMQTHGPRG